MRSGSFHLFRGTHHKISRYVSKKKLYRRTGIASVALAIAAVFLIVRLSFRSHVQLSRAYPEETAQTLFSSRRQGPKSVLEANNAPVSASLALFAALRRLFDQQRMASSYADAASPASAGLRAAAAAALDAASEPVFDELAAARKAATEAADAMIYRHQFPADCSNARLLLCSIDKDCGFACQLHHGVHLLALALATNRTLVLYAEEWRYGGNGARSDEFEDNGGVSTSSSNEEITGNRRNNGDNDEKNQPNPNVWSRFHGIHTAAPASSWERVFARVTHCATGGDDWLATLPQLRRGQEHDEARAVVATVIDGEALQYDPPSVPHDIMQLVSRFHSRPEVWWVGALARYLLRPAPTNTKGFSIEEYARRAARLGLQPGQYIGMHVRRTDKIEQTLNESGEWPAEAARHELGEYVEAAEAWHAEMSLAMKERKKMTENTRVRTRTTTRLRIRAGSLAANLPDSRNPTPLTVYLATDDASLASQAPLLYPHIRWVTNPAGATDAALHRRNSLASLLGVVDDLYFLSHADAVVGSFTSQVSRLAYELLQHEHAAADASLRYHSVDSQWYFGGGPPMRWCVRWRDSRLPGFAGNAVAAAAAATDGHETEASGPKTAATTTGATGDAVSVKASAAVAGSGLVADKAQNQADRRKKVENQALSVVGVSSPPAENVLLLCEADVAGVQGRVRCRSQGNGGEWVDVPAAALKRCI